MGVGRIGGWVWEDRRRWRWVCGGRIGGCVKMQKSTD